MLHSVGLRSQGEFNMLFIDRDAAHEPHCRVRAMQNAKARDRMARSAHSTSSCVSSVQWVLLPYFSSKRAR
jgi:hypothetical protein